MKGLTVRDRFLAYRLELAYNLTKPGHIDRSGRINGQPGVYSVLPIHCIKGWTAGPSERPPHRPALSCRRLATFWPFPRIKASTLLPGLYF